jgi:(4S)-4-hydroxy-5-phosphonooxypentane-2,3-dione isomerase
MFVVWVDIQVNAEHIDAFIRATEDNHRHTIMEPGNRRFDVLRLNDQPTHFRLYEVYVDEAAFKAHQQTQHYLRWRDAVEPFMAVKRSAEKLISLFPNPWA